MKCLWKTVFALTAVVVLVGCGKKERPVQPTEFQLDESGPVLTEEKLFEQQTKRQVVADFNNDNLQDYAIIEEDSSGVNQVSIYLQRESRELAKQYLQAAGIYQLGEYKISAIMAKDSAGGTDLAMIYKYADGLRELVHYRIEGNKIEEVLRSTP